MHGASDQFAAGSTVRERRKGKRTDSLAIKEPPAAVLLHQMAESIIVRAPVAVAVRITDDCDLPAGIKVVLHRIAQKSLNNVARHAGATQVSVHLRCGRLVELEIIDDGIGFVTDTVPSDSLGLGIMRERAEEIGARLIVDSHVGEGTKVHVTWARPLQSRFGPLGAG